MLQLVLTQQPIRESAFPKVGSWETCRLQSLRFFRATVNTKVGCVFGIRTGKRARVQQST